MDRNLKVVRGGRVPKPPKVKISENPPDERPDPTPTEQELKLDEQAIDLDIRTIEEEQREAQEDQREAQEDEREAQEDQREAEETERERQNREQEREDQERREREERERKEEQERRNRERKEEQERKNRERKEEQERKNRERREEQERKEQERKEQERQERERKEQERKEQERQERERKAREREEQERRNKAKEQERKKTQTYQGLLDQTNIENELQKYGYKIEGRIIAKELNGERVYIRAINSRGQRVFVLVDVVGDVVTRNDKLVLVENKIATLIPHSVRNEALDCVRNDVCGVALEQSEDRVCMLSFDEELNPKEVNLTILEESAPASLTVEYNGEEISYPVIKLSEIRANSYQVLLNTNKVVVRLRNTAYVSLVRDFEDLSRSEETLRTLMVEFDRVRNLYAGSLNETLTELERYAIGYERKGDLTDAEVEKYRIITEELTYRNKATEALFRGLQKINKHIEGFKDTMCDLQGVIEYFKEDNKRVRMTVVD